MIYTAKDLKPNTVPTFPEWHLKQSDLYLDYENWYYDVIGSCKSFDAVSYTAHVKFLGKCKKLICAKLLGDSSEYDVKTKIRMADNIHTKLYIVRMKTGNDQVWVGSGNLCSSSAWHNIMTRVGEVNVKTLKLYFNNLWNLTSPKET